MSTSLIEFSRFRALAPRWSWRTRDEGMITPGEMRTSHIFYTLRMIWNEAFPDLIVGRRSRFTFGPNHPRAYLAEAIAHLGSELVSRDDVEPWMRAQLEEMAAHLFRKRITGRDGQKDEIRP